MNRRRPNRQRRSAGGPGGYERRIVESSPLRAFDPRTKLALGTCASLAVMLPLERMAIFGLVYVVFLGWARLLKAAGRQLWRIKWLVVAIFAIDWLFLGLDLATIITLRLVLLTVVFVLFVSTTTPEEFRVALERLGVSGRYAFSLSLAFQSVDMLRAEWRAIQEAQRARGVWALDEIRLRRLPSIMGELVMLTVPAIVLTTRRAWAITESASARGFGSPHRRPYRELHMRARDWIAITAAVSLMACLIGL